MQFIRSWADRLADALQDYKPHLGQITLACGMGMVLLGFPAQIMTNYRTHECGINPILVVVAGILYGVRIPYQIAARAWYLLPADVLGFLFNVVLMGQYIAYR